MEPITTSIQVGIHDMADLEVTEDGQYLIVAYQTGAINMHQIGDMSFNFVMQI